MKKEEILVPKDKCPLDVLAEMGEQTRNSWIFLHRNAWEKLMNTSNRGHESNLKYFILIWDATDKYPKTEVCVRVKIDADWLPVYSISADNIAFHSLPKDPKDIFFLKMEE